MPDLPRTIFHARSSTHDLLRTILTMIDLGHGFPIVMIPGIQGRPEWMLPAIEALASRCRVLSFSLCGEPTATTQVDAQFGFDRFIRQIDDLLAAARLDRVALCGVSYGGLIAIRYAARRPSAVATLVLVSAPPPGWQPSLRIRRYMRAPWLYGPLFMMQAPGKFRAELKAALPGAVQRWSFKARALRVVAGARPSPTRMSERVRLLEGIDFAAEAAAIQAPTLIVTGERELDWQVSAHGTREYAGIISGATLTELPHTGHLGLVTRPALFADVVTAFLERSLRSPEGGFPRTSEVELQSKI